MAKYTTLVRTICEVKSNTETKGLSNINDILDKSWDKIFTKNWEIFDESYREFLCKKILKSYYTREICAETVELWRLWLDAEMCRIMPYYNELYKTLLFEYNPLYTTDYTKIHKGNYKENTDATNSGSTKNNAEMNNTKSGTNTENETNSINDSTTTTKNATNTSTGTIKNDITKKDTNKFSDTPQGGLTGIEDDKYLTNATINDVTENNKSDTTANETIKDENKTVSNSGATRNKINEINEETTNTTNSSSTNSNSSNSNKNSFDEWSERICGKVDSTSYASIIKEFRDNIINIDNMIISELSCLFMQLW